MVYKEEAFIQDDEKDKEDKKKNPVKYYVKFSFMLTYILLLTTATITFIEALRTPIPKVRHVFNLETCISLIAGYFYSIFVGKIEDYGKAGKIIDWADITKTRYIDWAMTTPLMLFVLSVVLAHNSKKKVSASFMLIILLLNYFMLYTGYLGENGELTRITALVLGFVAFFMMFGIIFYTYLQGNMIASNYGLYGVYFIVWTVYGIAYMLSEEYKNIIMNILDCVAKCFVGLGLWVYYSKIIDSV